jgi:uncharacterized caspase-like protein
LIFYAGHGVQIDGENYLLPVDVRPDSGAQLKATTISLNTVLSGLDDRVRTTIVILDACRDNPLAPQAATPAVAGRSSRASRSGGPRPRRCARGRHAARLRDRARPGGA